MIFGLTRFVWNIDIKCDGEFDKSKIINILSKNGIEEGKLISKIDTGKTINDICMNNEDISWGGIKIKEEIIDENSICDIVAKKEGIITKITARNGTAVAKEGDLIKEGDVLISNLIEGKYTDARSVVADRRRFS